VQPGFQDAAPGLVPDMKEDPTSDLPETPGGRFAKQIAEAPEGQVRRLLDKRDGFCGADEGVGALIWV
jgi:hypothetical protein